MATDYKVHPQSKFPWGCLHKQNPIKWKDLLEQIQQVLSYFSTYSPPELRHLSYRRTTAAVVYFSRSEAGFDPRSDQCST